MSSLAALFLKTASGNNKNIIQLIFFDVHFYLGGLLYFGASLGTIIALKYLAYSTVYFFSAFTYIWSVILAKIFLQEKISFNKVTAIGLILIGILFIVN